MGTSQQFSLRWNNYLSHITGAFDSLRSDEELVDVTLSCEGKRIRAHKMLLSACSTYFRDLFKENPCQHPVVIFRNVKFEDLVALVDFMYQGEVNVVQEQLASFLTTAELLAVQGLSEGAPKDSQSETSKEPECLEPPDIVPEPDVQMSDSLSQKQKLPNASDVSSPLSFFPVDTTDSPSAKRRKWSSVSGQVSKSSVGLKKESDSDVDRRRSNPPRNSSPDPVEIIPVVQNLKMEMPDYEEPEQDASSCSYGDSNQGGSGSRDHIPTLSQGMSLQGASASMDGGKQEPPDIYSTSSREAMLQPSTDTLPAPDLGQMLSKPGTSGEAQSQDSLQGGGGVAEFWKDPVAPAANESITEFWKNPLSAEGWLPSFEKKKIEFNNGVYLCKVCGKSFRRLNSCYDHMAFHQGTSKCQICNCVLSRKGNMKRHMRVVHGMDKSAA